MEHGAGRVNIGWIAAHSDYSFSPEIEMMGLASGERGLTVYNGEAQTRTEDV